LPINIYFQNLVLDRSEYWDPLPGIFSACKDSRYVYKANIDQNAKTA
jgi:hypothetical protein